ncbi:MAG: ABC-F family ATP-binding cassette domain-containing protein [Candidatus Daviesbacteria bacterium]|nr:ABC-F family ATP-binding cassette domain-containing protein [Candidatus Daviesbacteria bacterium]
MISVHNLSFSHNSHHIFEDAEFTITDGQKVGLIGHNGAGKSTLLKILCKQEIPQNGKIEITGTIGIVPQEVKHDPIMEASATIREYLNPDHTKQDYELYKMISGVELSDLDMEASPKDLSGGQKTRLALARALLAEPDTLLLDEPTNFLDTAGKKWVMGFLSNYPKTLILISHDLELLDKHINKILFVNSELHKIEEYRGNYTQALEQRAEKEATLIKQVHVEQRNISRLEESAKGMGVKQRINLQKRVHKLKEKLPDLPPEVRAIRFRLPEPATVGALPIKALNISKSYGEKEILKGINLSIERGECVALIGPNGVGKSTFIKILMGLLEPNEGEILRESNLKVGYYSQEFENLDFDKNLLETAMSLSHQPESVARPLLASFLFPASKVYQKIGTLSGGEKTRLSIALLLLQDYNLLILDEPTTYLDMMSQRIILQVLKEYKGALLIVSHTEEFIQELQPSRALILPENYFDVWSEDLLERVSSI